MGVDIKNRYFHHRMGRTQHIAKRISKCQEGKSNNLLLDWGKEGKVPKKSMNLGGNFLHRSTEACCGYREAHRDIKGSLGRKLRIGKPILKTYACHVQDRKASKTYSGAGEKRSYTGRVTRAFNQGKRD